MATIKTFTELSGIKLFQNNWNNLKKFYKMENLIYFKIYPVRRSIQLNKITEQ